MSKIWTTEEINFLNNNYSQFGAKYCADELNRTNQSVINKAGRLGLKYEKWKKTHEQYLEDLFSKEIDFIPLDQYIDSKTKIRHQCLNEHIISIKPNDVLNGVGCSICKIRTTKDYQELISYKVLGAYINSKTKIDHQCTKGHIWSAQPRSILAGSGCPKCSGSKYFDDTKPSLLYYIKITNLEGETYYKLGITNKTVYERFHNDRAKYIEIISQKEFKTGLEARNRESELLNNYKHYRVNKPHFLNSGGNSELFEFDIQPSL